MAYLAPHFEYDVFVSYSHGDPNNAGASPLKRWTNDFIRELKAEVQSVDTEFDDLHLWFDEQIDPTAALTQELGCNRLASKKSEGNVRRAEKARCPSRRRHA